MWALRAGEFSPMRNEIKFGAPLLLEKLALCNGAAPSVPTKPHMSMMETQKCQGTSTR